MTKKSKQTKKSQNPTNKAFELLTPALVTKSSQESGGVRIKGWANTTTLDRAGDVILADAWTKGGLSNFNKNPIILFNHDPNQPIGRGLGITPTDRGLELEAEISRKAPGNIADLVEDEVLKTFSVSFMIKDADWNDATGGLIIKDVELLEVSVVSIPCNQDSTFELSKAFKSDKDYDAFVEQFKQQDHLPEEPSSKEEENSDHLEATKSGSTVEPSTDNEELDMNEEQLKALLEQVAKQSSEAALAATQKAAEDAEKARKQAEAERTEKAEKEEELVAKVNARFEEQLKSMKEATEAREKALEDKLAEKQQEMENMVNSKRVFSDRSQDVTAVQKFSTELTHAYMLGVMTNKGYDTKFARDVFEKAGITYDTSAPDIDQEVSRMIEKEVTLNLRTAGLFREIPVRSAATVLPIQPDVEKAVFQSGAAPGGNLQNRGDTDNTFKPKQVILNAYRLISQTYMDNHVDEEVLIDLMPMLIDSVARAHARAVDNAVINGDGSITGLLGYATAAPSALSIGGSDKLTAAALVESRNQMGKYGINPKDVAYVVSQKRYYDLINDPEFKDITDVGSDVATKITGTVGAVYGSPVIVSDSFADEAAGEAVAVAVAIRNYAIPRLRGVTVEQDYEVGNQRRVLVATQSLGFEELVPTTADNRSSVRINLAA